LDIYAGRVPATEARQALLASDRVAADAPLVGARKQYEITARMETLRADAQTPPLEARDIALIEALLDVRAPLPRALEQMEALSAELPAIAPAVARVSARRTALEARGIDTNNVALIRTNWFLQRIMAARRWNIMTASSLAFGPRGAMICLRWQQAGAMTR